MTRTVLGLLLCAVPVFGAHPLTTDDAGIVGMNQLEFEAGYDNAKSADEGRAHTSGVSLKHGISERMDIGVFIPHNVAPLKAENFGDANLGLKLGLVKDILAFSVSNDLGKSSYLLNCIMSCAAGKHALHFNAGYQASGDPAIPGSSIYRIAGERSFGVIDIVAEASHDGAATGDWLCGIRYHLENIGFADVAAGKDFGGETDKFVLGFHTEF